MGDTEIGGVDDLLLKSQQSTILQALADVGIPRSSISFSPDLAKKSISIVYVPKPTYSFLLHGLEDSRFQALQRPGERRPSRNTGPYHWDQLRPVIHGWAKALKREIDVPDFLDDFSDSADPTTAKKAADTTNEPFSKEEIRKLHTTIDELQEFIFTHHEIDERNHAAIRADLLHLKEAASKTGKKDWLLMFYGTLFNFGINRLLESNVVRDAFTFASPFIADLFQGPGSKLLTS